jgi:DNA modification methylase
VLDPFMGSGTTAVSCVDLNRNYIGVELHQEYVDMAEDRIARFAPLDNFFK